MTRAKTSRPALSKAVARPRLFRRLDSAARAPVIWVWGPPGAGKSTLVSSYLEARAIAHLWYQVDEGDGDLATFFYYLGQAAPHRRRALPLLTPAYQPDISAFSRRFFRDLLGRFKSSYVIVLDNYQEVSAADAFHDVVRHLIEETPQHGRVIVISRSEPPPILARYRVHQRMEFVAWEDLRFTPGEAARLLRASSAARWRPDMVRSLYESADGWGAGLVLLAKQASSQPLRTRQIAPTAAEVLFDYFEEEILTRVDRNTRDVLSQTAFLPHLTATTAADLTGLREAGDVLARLHRRNYFTNRRADRSPVYEYHRLFRAFLLSHACRSYDATRLSDIRRRAAAIAESYGLIDAAASLLREGEEWTLLAALIGRAAPQLLAQGRRDTVERHLTLLPTSTLQASPWLLYWRGVCGFAWRHSESRRDLEDALRQFEQQADAAGVFLAWSALVWTAEAESNLAGLDELRRQFDTLALDYRTSTSIDVETRVAAAMLSIIRSRGSHDSEPWAHRALELARQSPDKELYAITAFNWFIHYFETGNHVEAVLVVNDMRTLIRSHDTAPEVALAASMVVVWCEALTGDPAYRATAAQALQNAEALGIFHAARFGIVCGALIGALGNGDLESARVFAGEFEKHQSTLGLGYRAVYAMYQMHASLARGDVAGADARRAEMVRCTEASGWLFFTVATHLLSAQVLGGLGDIENARTDFNRAVEFARAMQSPYVDFMVQLTRADLSLNSGQSSESLHALRSAMTLGRVHGFFSTYVLEPVAIARLCGRALDEAIEVDYVRQLIQKWRLTSHQPPSESDAWPWPVRITTLGRFEVLLDGHPLVFSTKAQRKPLALLKALIAFGAERVREEELIDHLWPDAAGDAGRFALTTTLHRLRRLLGQAEVIQRQDRHVSLDRRMCWIDALALRTLLDRAGALRADDTESWATLRALTPRIRRLYRGPFLSGEDDDAPWVRPMRDGLQARMVKHLMRVGMHDEQQAAWSEASEIYEVAAAVDPTAENVCRQLMICYGRLAQRSDVERVFRRCSDSLAARLGAVPSAETRALWRQLRAISHQ